MATEPTPTRLDEDTYGGQATGPAQPLWIRTGTLWLVGLVMGALVSTGRIGPDTGPVAQGISGMLVFGLTHLVGVAWAWLAVSPAWKVVAAGRGLYLRLNRTGAPEA